MKAMAPPVFVTNIGTATDPLNVAVVNAPALVIKNSQNGSTATKTDGTFTQLNNIPCSYLTVVNNTGASLIIQQNNQPFYVLPGTYFTFNGITNANQLSAAYADNSGATVFYRAEG
ncbi:hypothetical protein AD947_07400 [Acetobacter tropicalis]|uniref:Uncharacterized protein n=1 Tax=Acetobacter tropicalis TaxID=104102 RepID=A0A149TY33_9PROT|nr:hypothetical protein [Acetobacter tropicalis]KXV58006.1 hypothetical protein AD947_07400 [Acetobacter tropicalis]